MREYENNSTNNSNNSKNNVALRITTLIINFHTSFSLERSRVIEKYFTEHEEALALTIFQLNLSFKEDSLFSRSKRVARLPRTKTQSQFLFSVTWVT